MLVRGATVTGASTEVTAGDLTPNHVGRRIRVSDNANDVEVVGVLSQFEFDIEELESYSGASFGSPVSAVAIRMRNATISVAPSTPVTLLT